MKQRLIIASSLSLLAMLGVSGCGIGGGSLRADPPESHGVERGEDAAADEDTELDQGDASSPAGAEGESDEGGSESDLGDVVETPSSDAVASSLVGQNYVGDGFEIKVTKVATSPTISVNDSGYRAGSPYAKYSEKRAAAGSEYVVVASEVKNTSKTSMDLTCDWPLDIKALNMDAQQYDTIDDLYKISGNPECNAGLQPGTSTKMTYIFEVPSETPAVALAVSPGALEGVDDDVPGIIYFDKKYEGIFTLN